MGPARRAVIAIVRCLRDRKANQLLGVIRCSWGLTHVVYDQCNLDESREESRCDAASASQPMCAPSKNRAPLVQHAAFIEECRSKLRSRSKLQTTGRFRTRRIGTLHSAEGRNAQDAAVVKMHDRRALFPPRQGFGSRQMRRCGRSFKQRIRYANMQAADINCARQYEYAPRGYTLCTRG